MSDYQFLKIDTSVLSDGDTMLDKYRKSPDGVPWFTILDGDGKELVNSTGPDGNIGCPVMESEIAHFMAMIKQTSKVPSEKSLASLKKSLEDYTQPWRSK